MMTWQQAVVAWLRAGAAYREATTAALAGWDCFYCGDPAASIDHVQADIFGKVA